MVLVFFIFPASQAIWGSFLREDAFGLSRQFVWFENFARILGKESYLNCLIVTTIFTVSVVLFALAIGLYLAVQVDRVIRGSIIYKTFLICPYAVAPAVAGVLWMFIFNPTLGIVAHLLKQVGYEWNHLVNGNQAMLLVVIAAAWKRCSYNFLFFLAGLQSIPRTLIEAAAIDGAGPRRTFWDIIFPLLSPTTFFLIVVNGVYAFVDTFGVIHVVTQGGPAGATSIMVYKIFYDGFISLDLGGSSAQSVILMLIMIALTVIQFRYVERRVHY